MIEAYLDPLTKEDKIRNDQITPFVKSLSGVIDIPDEIVYKKNRDFLAEQ